MKELIDDFIDYWIKNKFDIYNEAGLQHELGYFLRVVKDIPVRFEYNIQRVVERKNCTFLKKEMDLYFEVENQRNCIEIKFPNNGAYPRRMPQSLKDVYFLQQLINNGFKNGVFFFITDLAKFTKGDLTNGIYSYFRNHKDISLFSPEDIPSFLIKTDEKVFYEVLKDQAIKLPPSTFINFKDLVVNDRQYFYFLLELEN